MNKARLTEEIEYELSQLSKLADTVKAFLVSIGLNPQPWHAAAGAKYISDLVIGLENLCKRNNRALQREIPEGPEYHQNILDNFIQDNRLGGQLDPAIALRLKKYLRFRHRFIHGYGHDIHWEIIDEPLRLLPDTIGKIIGVWRKWLSELP
jgi:hypothetical protein